MKALFLILALFTLASCNGKGGAFSDLEEDVLDDGDDGPIVISSFTPTANPVVMTSIDETFAIALEAGAGNVTYSFALDGLVTQTGPEPFTVVDGSSLSVGTHTLIVTATNTVASASHTFNLLKNTPPVLGVPTISATTVSCLGGTFTMSAAATDANGDAMTFEFFLNGASGSSTLANTYLATSASTIFTPTCALTGINTIRLRVTDSNGEYDEETVTVTVSNPSVASIIDWSPQDNPIIVRSDETENFSITPDGTPPFVTTWSIAPGGAVAGCPSANACSIAGGGTYVGAHVLTASMDDGSSSPPVTRDFNVIFNAKPGAIPASISPSNAAPIKKNCAEETTFTVNVVDSNYADTTATNNIIWKIDGNTVPAGTLTVVTNNSTHPFTSSATFKPNCQEAYLGDHTITVEFTDGFESDDVEWDISTSFMSTACLNLTAGRTCTLVGRPSLLKSSDLSVTANQKYASIMPTFITPHPDGGLFISDRMNHVVWFYNLNAATPITVFGQVVPGQNIIPLVGTGSAGLGTDGEVLTNHYLNEPYGMEWDNTNDILYVADGVNNRVLAVTGSGAVNRIIGGAATADGSTSITTRCNGPRGMVKSGDFLYVVCNGNTTDGEGHVKRFNLTTGLGYTVVRYANGGGNVADTIGSLATAGRIRQAWGIAKHPSKEIFFVVERSACQVVALNLDTSDTFAGVAVNANRLGILTANGGCDNPGNGNVVASSGAGRMEPIDIAVRANGAALEGLYLSQWSRGGALFLNTTGSPITVGGVAVPAANYRVVFGVMGVQGFSRGIPATSNTTVNHSMGLAVLGNTLYMADHRNARVVTLDTSVNNGAVSDIFASEPYFGYDGEVDLPLHDHRLYGPIALAFNSTTKELIFSEAFNGRIRAINLTNGRLRTKIGNGTFGTTTSAANARLSTPVDYVTDLAYLSGDNLTLYTEMDTNHAIFNPNINPFSFNGNGTFRSCYVRALNESASTTNWGVSLGENFVTSVVGNYGLGCQNWAGGNELQAPNSISYGQATGVGGLSNGNTFWSSHRGSHCIQETTGAGVGTIETVIGACGTAANTPGTIGTNSTARIDLPGDIEMDTYPAYSANGNFFFVDRSLTTTSRIKYANLSASGVNFDGDTVTDVPPGEVREFINTTDGFVAGVAFYDDTSEGADNDWLCYSQGPAGSGSANAQNVICRSRDLTKTFRIGRSSVAAIRGKKPSYPSESENVINTSASLNRPHGLAFDDEGNLYIAEYGSHVIKMVKKWW